MQEAYVGIQIWRILCLRSLSRRGSVASRVWERTCWAGSRMLHYVHVLIVTSATGCANIVRSDVGLEMFRDHKVSVFC